METGLSGQAKKWGARLSRTVGSARDPRTNAVLNAVDSHCQVIWKKTIDFSDCHTYARAAKTLFLTNGRIQGLDFGDWFSFMHFQDKLCKSVTKLDDKFFVPWLKLTTTTFPV